MPDASRNSRRGGIPSTGSSRCERRVSGLGTASPTSSEGVGSWGASPRGWCETTPPAPPPATAGLGTAERRRRARVPIAATAPRREGRAAAGIPAEVWSRVASTPTDDTTTTATPATAGRRRATSDSPTPSRARITRVPTTSAALSFFPKVSMAKSLTPGGTLSITSPPTATTGDPASATIPPTSSPTATPTPAASRPAATARSVPREGRGRDSSAMAGVRSPTSYGLVARPPAPIVLVPRSRTPRADRGTSSQVVASSPSPLGPGRGGARTARVRAPGLVGRRAGRPTGWGSVRPRAASGRCR